MKQLQRTTYTIADLSKYTGFLEKDILDTCVNLQKTKYYKGNHIVCIPPKIVLEYLELKQFRPPKLPVHPEFLRWNQHKRYTEVKEARKWRKPSN